jgi:hypothetical protein
MALLRRGMPIYLIMKILEHNRVGGQGKWAVVRRAVIAATITGWLWGARWIHSTPYTRRMSIRWFLQVASGAAHGMD